MESARIKFGITFEGSSQCWEGADVCAIDLHGLKSGVSAISVGIDGSSGSRVQAGKLQWSISSKDPTRPFLQIQKRVDQIGLTSEVANSFGLTARVSESYDNLSRLERGLDGSIKPQQCVRWHDVAIEIAERSELKAGKTYLIRIQNIGERCLRASFAQVEELKSRTSSAKLVVQPRVTPMTASAVSSESVRVDSSTLTQEQLRDIKIGASFRPGQSLLMFKTSAFPSGGVSKVAESEELTPDQDKIYGDFLGSTVVVMDGWIKAFAKEAGVSNPEDTSYESSCGKIAQKELKRQIKLMDKSHLDVLLGFIREAQMDSYDDYLKAQASALGFEGYKTFMKVILEAVICNRSGYEAIIEKHARRYAEHLCR